MKIVNENQKINKFLEKLNITFYLTPTQIRYLVLYMYFYFEINFNAKIKDISNVYFCNSHRSSINRFITNSPWDEEKVLTVLKRDVIKTIQDISIKSKNPIELIIDDTISIKTKPSSKAINTIEGTQFHFYQRSLCLILTLFGIYIFIYFIIHIFQLLFEIVLEIY